MARTSTVINRFINVNNKNKFIFMQFDIAEFCPLISKELLMEALT